MLGHPGDPATSGDGLCSPSPLQNTPSLGSAPYGLWGSTPYSARLSSHASTSGFSPSFPSEFSLGSRRRQEGLSRPCDVWPVPFPCPSLRPPSLFKLLFSTLFKLHSSTARLLHSHRPIGGPHSRRGSAPLPAGGQSTTRESSAGARSLAPGL